MRTLVFFVLVSFIPMLPSELLAQYKPSELGRVFKSRQYKRAHAQFKRTMIQSLTRKMKDPSIDDRERDLLKQKLDAIKKGRFMMPPPLQIDTSSPGDVGQLFDDNYRITTLSVRYVFDKNRILIRVAKQVPVRSGRTTQLREMWGGKQYLVYWRNHQMADGDRRTIPPDLVFRRVDDYTYRNSKGSNTTVKAYVLLSTREWVSVVQSVKDD